LERETSAELRIAELGRGRRDAGPGEPKSLARRSGDALYCCAAATGAAILPVCHNYDDYAGGVDFEVFDASKVFYEEPRLTERMRGASVTVPDRSRIFNFHIS